MASYELLDQSDEDALHAARLLNVEEKLYKRLTKRLLAPGSFLSAAPQAPPTPPPEIGAEEADALKQAELDKQAGQLKQWQQDAYMDFGAFDSNVVRAQLLLKSNERERERYAVEKEKIQETAQAVRQTNTALHEQLKAAQRTLEVRKGYDELAEKITSNKALKPREEQLAQLEKLHQEIAELEKESQDYAQTWAERREQFGKIVEEGMQMLRLIRDEKEEAERKEGMEEIGPGDDRDTSPSRGEASHAGTPAGGATPAHVPEVQDKPSPPPASKLRDEIMAVNPLNPPEPSESGLQQPNGDGSNDSDLEEGEAPSGDSQTTDGPTIQVSKATPEADKLESNNADQMDIT